MIFFNEEDEELQILYRLWKYLTSHKKEELFVEDVYEFFEKYSYITHDQLEILKKIYMKYNLYDQDYVGTAY